MPDHSEKTDSHEVPQDRPKRSQLGFKIALVFLFLTIYVLGYPWLAIATTKCDSDWITFCGPFFDVLDAPLQFVYDHSPEPIQQLWTRYILFIWGVLVF